MQNVNLHGAKYKLIINFNYDVVSAYTGAKIHYILFMFDHSVHIVMHLHDTFYAIHVLEA